ncbi:Aminopeptidase N [Orchesella cincta]|uniref:Aminopeptidase N n=1 Tax=Orchesella cincta TaxID=48709 RepID=A0A1D2MJA2_ORCCI|nr:Aminopeptidase N [Orchesella cincta]
MGCKIIAFLLFFSAFAQCKATSSKTFIPSHYEIELRVILEDNEQAGEKFSAPGETRIFGVTGTPTSKLELVGYQLNVDKESVTVLAKNGTENLPDNKEPLNFKFTFDLTIIRKENYTSLSNTEIVSSTPDPKHQGWVVDKYARTIPITPSLVSLLISDFSHVNSTSFLNKTVNVHAPQHLLQNDGGEYLAKTGAKLLDFYSEYLDSSFQSPKMDFAIIPKFYKSVESFGLTFLPEKMDDVSLLQKPGATIDSKFLVDGTLAQNLARQWVGPWWNDNYLNLGIVRYLKYLGMQEADPDMSANEISYLEAVQSSFKRDTYSLDNHTLATTLWKNEVIANRGATLLRMLDAVLPQETIQKAFQTYVKKINEKDEKTDAEAFYQILQDASGDNSLNVSSFMHSWTNQVGYPVVKVEAVNDTFVKLTQKAFKVSEEEEYSNQNATWAVPITVYTEERPLPQSITVPQFWWKENGTDLHFQHNISSWFMINHSVSGYYRVLYDHSLLKLIQQQLERNASVISPLSRAQLVDDYFIFAEKNYSDIQTALNLTRYLEQETEYVPWRIVFNHFDQFYQRFSSHFGYPVFQEYLNKKLDSALSSIGIEESPEDKRMRTFLRSDLLRWACTHGEPSPLCALEAKKLLETWNVNGTDSGLLSQSLSCAAVATGGNDAFDVLYQRYETLSNNKGTKDEREEMLGPLTCATNTDILEGLYNKTANENSTIFRMNDGKFLLNALIEKAQARVQLLPFLNRNLDEVLDLYNTWNKPQRSRVKRTRFIRHEGAELVENLLSKASIFYSTQAQLDEIDAFAKENKIKLLGSYVNIQYVLGTRKHNVEWMNTTGKSILEWLQSVEDDKM